MQKIEFRLQTVAVTHNKQGAGNDIVNIFMLANIQTSAVMYVTNECEYTNRSTSINEIRGTAKPVRVKYDVERLHPAADPAQNVSTTSTWQTPLRESVAQSARTCTAAQTADAPLSGEGTDLHKLRSDCLYGGRHTLHWLQVRLLVELVALC